MGGILEVSGVFGFLSGRERLYNDADSETREWAMLCAAWFAQYEHRPVSAKDLFDILKEHDLLLDLWGGRSGQGALQRLGHALNARRDRVFGGYKIRNAGKDTATKSNAYRLERAPGKNSENPEHPENTVTDAHHAPGFSGGFEAADAKTPAKPRQNPETENDVQDGASAHSPGVFRVLNRPQPKHTDEKHTPTWEGLDL